MGTDRLAGRLLWIVRVLCANPEQSSVVPAILAIGLDPAHADFTATPGVTPDLARSYVISDMDRLRREGFAVIDCLISPDARGIRRVEAELRAERYACVLIGAAVRESHTPIALFECIINLVHTLAAEARICFDSSPGDMTQAVRRWVSPAEE